MMKKSCNFIFLISNFLESLVYFFLKKVFEMFAGIEISTTFASAIER